MKTPIVMKHHWEEKELVVRTHLRKIYCGKYPLIEEGRRTQLPPDLYRRGENSGYIKGDEKDSRDLKSLRHNR